jgi:hypothetical protein
MHGMRRRCSLPKGDRAACLYLDWHLGLLRSLVSGTKIAVMKFRGRKPILTSPFQKT